MTIPLTRRKTAWANRWKPEILRGDAIAPNAAVSSRYQAKLEQMIRRMIADAHAAMEGLYGGRPAQEFFAMDDSISSAARIVLALLRRKYDRMFGGNAKWLAESFATQADAANSKSVHMSIQKLTGGLSLGTRSFEGPERDIIKASVAENVSLIKSIPEKYLGGVEQAVYRSITTGNGLQDLVPYLKKSGDLTLARARMIAHDQTTKITNNMTRERMVKLGVQEYEWLHIPSNRPRHYHQNVLNGKIFRYDDPPIIDEDTGERGIPGQLINCHCLQRPVITFERENAV
jgi:SPP1 gp7 family putative phage head morphogenesis protein